VNITDPVGSTSFVAPATIPVTVDVSDPDAGDSISSVEYYRDGMLAGTATTAPYNFTLTEVPVGSYRLLAKAYDAEGASRYSNLVTVTVDENTAAHVIMSEPTATVRENQTAGFGVALSAQPATTTTVTVGRTSGDSDIVVTGGSTLTFTPENWNVGQSVTLGASADPDSAVGTTTVTATAAGYQAGSVSAMESETYGTDSKYVQEFTELYNKIHNSANKYFSPEGVPYHSIETLMVEAPDHGHETTSEAFSYYLLLEAQHGRLTQDWAPFNKAWQTMEKYIIPSATDYKSGGYKAAEPATYAPEHMDPADYPTTMDKNVKVGKDPIAAELKSAYGNDDIYGMHWIIDVDNVYGFGKCGDGKTKPAYLNTYQRGPQESVWETIPQPSCDMFKFGNSTGGYLTLFMKEDSPAKQWKFTNAPDADARAVQAAYWALTWAKEQGKTSSISANVTKAAKMGDYLRYAMYDKYFKKAGCTSPSCAAGTGKDSAAYLLNWYYAWGGSINGDWSWRIGSSYNHHGYQNPLAAWAMSNVSELTPKGSTAKTDWATSVKRQIEFATWLQSDEGAIAGGATNSWDGAYATPPSGSPTFYGMAYDEDPVYHDPPSNQWFGMQAWGTERIAEYYYVTGDAKAKAILDKWVAWAISETTLGEDYRIPSDLGWSGKPGGNWKSGTTSVNNSGLHVTVKNYSQDIGPTGAYARLLTYYGVKAQNQEALDTAKGLLDSMLQHKDSKGFSVDEARKDYSRFNDEVAIPSEYTGKMPNGDQIQTGQTFLGLRSFYKKDPDWSKVQAYLDGGEPPVFRYHRFWAQIDVALALVDYGMLADS
jgi:hypothetical protein